MGRAGRSSRRVGASLTAVALAFASLPTAVTKLVVGMISAEEVGANVAALGESVPTGLWREAQGKGLLPPDLALP